MGDGFANCPVLNYVAPRQQSRQAHIVLTREAGSKGFAGRAHCLQSSVRSGENRKRRQMEEYGLANLQRLYYLRPEAKQKHRSRPEVQLQDERSFQGKQGGSP